MATKFNDGDSGSSIRTKMDSWVDEINANIAKLSGIENGAEVNVVDSVNTKTGAVVVDPDDLDDSATTNKFTTAARLAKTMPSGAIVGTTDTQTLTNKTLTTPVINELVDSSGNEFIEFSPQASAVNHLILYNGSTGNSPSFLAFGETNVGIDFSTSGTGKVTIFSDEVATLAAAQTFVQKTIDGDSNTVSNLAYSTIKSTSRTGIDTKLVTGTEGTDGNLIQWNADGDAVDGPTPPTGTIVGTSDGQTLTNKTLTSPVLNTGVSGTAVKDEDDMTSDSATHLATQQSIKAYTDNEIAAVVYPLIVAVSDESTALTTGTAKLTFRAPYAMTLTGVRASVTTAPTGATLTVDINESGTSVLSTKLTIDASEKTSTTAATAAVISDAAIADDAEITIDIDQIGSTVAGAGLKVTLLHKKA